MAVNPLCPNLADYRAFVYAQDRNASAAYPYAAGTVSAGTSATLSDIAANWAADQWDGCVVFDVTQSWGGLVISNTPTVASFIVSAGSVPLIDSSGAYVTDSSGEDVTATGNTLGLTPNPGDQYLIVQPSLSESLAIALCTVNATLHCASPILYTKAVYNLALDRLINFGIDVEGQTWLSDLRGRFEILAIETGSIASASDQGTSGSYVVPEQMQSFTLDELQLMKTPFGRAYLAIAQKYGQAIWGLS